MHMATHKYSSRIFANSYDNFFLLFIKIALSMLVLSICGKKKHRNFLIQEYFAISALKYLPREKSAGISCHNHFVKMVIGTSR